MKLRKFCLKTTVAIFSFFFLHCQYSFAVQQPTLKSISTAPANHVSDVTPPSIPESLFAENRTHTTILLTWSKSNDNVGIKGYQVYKDGKKILTTSKTTYTSRDLIPGKQYTYFLKAYDAAGNISESSEALCIATLSDSQLPTVPGSPQATAIDFTSITLSWKPSSDNTSIKCYEIFLCGTKKASTSSTSYICKGLSPGRTYNFTIGAIDIAGNCSSKSSTLYTQTTADVSAPSVPYGLKATSAKETEVTLVWSPASDNVKVKGYEIYCDGKKTGTSSKMTYTSKKLIPGKSYKYTIKAIDTSGLQSAESTCLTITTLKDLKKPTTPQNLKKSTIKQSSVSLSWDVSTDNIKVKGYALYCNGSIIATTTRTSRSVKIPSGLGMGIYWVRAYDQSENLSEKSNSITILTIK